MQKRVVILCRQLGSLAIPSTLGTMVFWAHSAPNFSTSFIKLQVAASRIAYTVDNTNTLRDLGLQNQIEIRTSSIFVVVVRRKKKAILVKESPDTIILIELGRPIDKHFSIEMAILPKKKMCTKLNYTDQSSIYTSKLYKSRQSVQYSVKTSNTQPLNVCQDSWFF